MDYKTLAGPAEACLVEKRSKFIANLSPVADEDEALQFIDGIRRRHPEARHHVFAYSLRGGTRRFSDDGEPQGTAGMPALEVLGRRGLENAAVVVTRYFGGVLLGAPGLLRAYTRAATMAAEAAQTIVMRKCAVYGICTDYAGLAGLEKLVRETEGRVSDAQYGEKVVLEVLIPAPQGERFLASVAETTSGSVSPSLRGETYITFAG